MKCRVCGRVLKSKESIKLGFGRTCYKKMKESGHFITCINDFLGDEE